jgi:GDP-mannose transporter
LLLEDWSSKNIAINFPPGRQWPMIAAMIFTGLSSIFISYCSAWCVRVTSSTTYSMVGALNKLPIAISGLVFFNAPVTFASVSAIFVGFVSGMVYTVAQIWKKKSQDEKTVLPTSSSSQSNRDSLKA